jgi:arabinan endo-1,5-alpha-L-arabinosidase
MEQIVDLDKLFRRVNRIRQRLISVHSTDCFFIGMVTLLNVYFFPLNAQHAGVIVHDPVMIRQDSTYYLFCTGKGITTLTAVNLIDWKYDGPVFDKVPAWTSKAVTDFKDHIWAPDISWHNGKYYLYYSVSAFAKNTSCIGLVTNVTLDPTDPRYHWNDHGIVIQSVPGRDMWNAIDPNLILDARGIPWLVFGSFWEGIKLVRLDSNYTAPAQPEEWFTLARRNRDYTIPERDPGNGAIEAPFVFRKNGYYYLFVSFDYCCRGKESNYKIMVGRSKEITGPYLDKLGTDMYYGGASLVLEGNSDWPGVGHNAVYTIDGKDYIIFHAYDASDEGKPKLMIRDITWDKDGWPVVVL